MGAGLIVAERRGTTIVYSLNLSTFEDAAAARGNPPSLAEDSPGAPRLRERFAAQGGHHIRRPRAKNPGP